MVRIEEIEQAVKELKYLKPVASKEYRRFLIEEFLAKKKESLYEKACNFSEKIFRIRSGAETERKFSEDLYNRLNTLSIHIPPLRDRAKEMAKIAQYILTEQSKKMKLKKIGISNNALKLLQGYWWPQNLRELENVIIRSAIFSESEILIEKDLFFEPGNEKNAFIAFLKKMETKPSPPAEKSPLSENNSIPSLFFFIDLIHRIKNPLVSIKTFTQLLRQKFDDVDFRDISIGS